MQAAATGSIARGAPQIRDRTKSAFPKVPHQRCTAPRMLCPRCELLRRAAPRAGHRDRPDMTEPLLLIRSLTAGYGRIVALRGVDLDVNDGEIVTLIGANGAGKSTLMMTIFGNPRAREGRIVFEGRDISALPTHEIAHLRIAQAPEGRRIFSRMTVLENLQMGAVVAGGAHFGEDLERVCSLFPRLKERLAQRGGTLSGGEQQMLAIARALMSNPRILLLDEPSMGLAPILVETIFDTLREIHRQGGTILLVEQNALMALEIANRGYVLESGRVVLHGTAAELRDNEAVQRSYLGIE